MKRVNFELLCLLLIVLLLAATPVTAQEWMDGPRPVVVSPGDSSEFSAVSGRCPTFNWASVEGADSYELVIFRLSEVSSNAPLQNQQPQLSTTVHGGATGWTPSLDQCLKAGDRYAWSVRAAHSSDVTEWAAPRLFRVATTPSREELDDALDVIQRFRSAMPKDADSTRASVEPVASPVQDGESRNRATPADRDGGDVIGVESELHSAEPHFTANGDGSAEANRLFAFTATPSGGNEMDGAVVMGHRAFNAVNSGRLQFDEGIADLGDCGFRFQHNGTANTLTLDGGCEFTTPFGDIAVFERGGPVTFTNKVTVDDIVFSKFGGANFTGAANGQLVLSFVGNSSNSCDTTCGSHGLGCDGAWNLGGVSALCTSTPSSASLYLCFCSGP